MKLYGWIDPEVLLIVGGVLVALLIVAIIALSYFDDPTRRA